MNCVGSKTNSSVVRRGEKNIVCTITVVEKGLPSIGLSSDYESPVIVGWTLLPGGITATSAGAKMTFKVQAPSATGTKFTVMGRIGGENFDAGAFEMPVRCLFGYLDFIRLDT